MVNPGSRKKATYKLLRRKIKGTALTLLVQSVRAVVNFLPRGASLKFAASLGRLAFYLLPVERSIMRQNLHSALGGEKSDVVLARIAKSVFVNQAKNLADFLLGDRVNKTSIRRLVSTEGIEHLEQAYRQGKGVILVTGHIGNWEILAAYLALAGFPLSVIGRRLNYPRLNKLLVTQRQSWGMEVIDRDTAGRPLIKAIRNKRLVGVLIDQDTKVSGVFVPFFGRPAHTPTGPIIAAYRTGALIVPIAIFRRPDDTYKVVTHPPVRFERSLDQKKAILKMVETLSGILERFIRREPGQWVWMHRRWRKQPGGQELLKKK